MKKLLTFIIIALILGGVAYGIYSVLPERSQDMARSKFQPVFDANAKEKIEKVKKAHNSNLDADYQTILEGHVNSHGWVYDKEEGKYKVTFLGNGASIKLDEMPDGSENLFLDTNIKIVFVIKDSNPDVMKMKIYLGTDEKLMDAAYYKEILRQLYEGNQ